MNVSYEYLAIAFLLLGGFFMLFFWIGRQNFIGRLMRITIEQMDANAKQRLLEERKRLLEGKVKDSVWQKTERILFYSGLKWSFPFLTVELFLLLNICGMAAAVLTGLVLLGYMGAAAFPAVVLAAEFCVIRVRMGNINRSVNENLPKFLDFLGNYSATNGELAAIFEQIARYMEKPLSIVLEECCHEAAFTGDMTMALLCMREKIEHPQFKALINDLEINMRYCADYTVLVQSSRRSLRDYLKAAGERKGLLREAVINALILMVMCFVSLAVVNTLIEESVWSILLFTLPGRISMGIILLIMIMFVGKLSRDGG